LTPAVDGEEFGAVATAPDIAKKTIFTATLEL
jgi:hypothetical protein